MDETISDENKECLTLAKRLLLKQENEEVWISSEDLRTEGSSSDDNTGSDSNHLKLPKMKKHNNKRIKNKKNKPSTMVVNKQRFDDGNSNENLAACCSKSELEREALNLMESQWRPKRGSLKLPQLVAADGYRHQTVENFNTNEIDRFYNEMLNKVSLLRENPLTENNYKEPKNLLFDDGKENDLMKNIPEVHQKLNFIRKLDDNLLEIIHQYQCEKMYEKNNDDEVYAQVCRNIQMIENGKIASMTADNEDKQKLHNLLENIDEDDDDDDGNNNVDNIMRKNAFALNDDDKKRIEQINMALKELNQDRINEK